jgi:hypothetical protein
MVSVLPSHHIMESFWNRRQTRLMETEVNHIDLREVTIDHKEPDERKNLSDLY